MAIIAAPFLINLIILANSRASFLAVIAIGLLALFWIKGKMRWRVVLLFLGGGILFAMLANEQFWERQSTIDDYHEEGSAVSRIYLWKAALEMWKDHPMGLGGDGYQRLVMDYAPELREIMEEKGAKTVHNTFLLVLVEWGPVGLFLFLGYLLHTLIILGRIRRDRQRSPGYRYFIDAMAIQMGLIAIIVAGIFHNRLYSEVIYWFGGFAAALRNIQVAEIQQVQEAQTEEEITMEPV